MRDKRLKQDSRYILLVTDLEQELLKQHTSPAEAEGEQYYLQLPQGTVLSTNLPRPAPLSSFSFFLPFFFCFN